MRVTIKQIAEIAGVHRSTVDKVIHNREGVSEEVRHRVQGIIDELDYKPNVIGKALSYQKRPMKIAVVLLQVDAQRQLKMGVDQAYKEFHEFGLDLEYYFVNSNEVTQLATILDVLIKSDFTGLILHPINHPDIAKRIHAFHTKGIPIITVNTDLKESSRDCFVGQDMHRAGRVAGNMMGQLLGGKGKVAIITGSGNLLSSIEREQAFEEVIDEYIQGLTIVDILETHENKTEALQKTTELLRKHKQLDGLYVTCGTVGEIGKALKLSGRSKDIKMITNDIYPEIVELMKADVVNVTICQDLIAQGYKSMKIMFEYLFYHKAMDEEYVYTDVGIRVKENIELSL